MIYLQDPDVTLHHGDVLDTLRAMPDGSVDCVVTSPPYWGLRDYGTGAWAGGDPDCDHIKTVLHADRDSDRPKGWDGNFRNTSDPRPIGYGDVCGKCGATRQDQQLGLEPTPDLFVARMVEVFREVRRVLAAHGTCWVNLGDSYFGTGRGPSDLADDRGFHTKVTREGFPLKGVYTHDTLKSKDLVGIPWRVAFALQQPYYTGRIAAERDRVWLAAMIDGEGTICGFRHERPDGNIRTGCLTFITNGSERILDECDRIWPGSRYTETLKPGDRVLDGVATRPCWRWELQSAEDRSALVRELHPYLIEKKWQALVAWNLLELVQAAKRMGRGGETTATKEKRDHLVRLLSDLNQKRPVDLPSWLAPVPGLYEPGWYVRSDVIWSKNNPMPESVTDRPTKSHEYVFLLTKQPRYWFDQEAVREPATNGERFHGDYGKPGVLRPTAHRNGRDDPHNSTAGRNIRSVWEIATQPYPEAHFATYPEELVRRCLLAGCPEWVCRVCGKPRERIVDKDYLSEPTYKDAGDKTTLTDGRNRNVTRMGDGVNVTTLGWSDCGHNNYRPGIVLDPFIGSGTTAHVARKHGRHAIGIDLNADYLKLAAKRLQQQSLFAEGVA